ncbi:MULTISPECIES: DUF1016 domain-containing protein [Pseudanabaena]|uniref:Uncharacterized protein n=2 Tax=Pseudanabaena TaxID=1152 RepID=L8N8G3_9CYAN|nr:MULTISPECIES: DUF1016 domain-containing protein [Pseudanabaena]ELS34523.1 protein of unknown function DUF1016 [Pseudanabaena biceps PCC 7429]MDG3493294.1 hypothetical protein [Pseudanabaena catenata USMAC16]
MEKHYERSRSQSATDYSKYPRNSANKQISPDLLLKDPYILDFLDISDRYLEIARHNLEEHTARVAGGMLSDFGF